MNCTVTLEPSPSAAPPQTTQDLSLALRCALGVAEQYLRCLRPQLLSTEELLRRSADLAERLQQAAPELRRSETRVLASLELTSQVLEEEPGLRRTLATVQGMLASAARCTERTVRRALNALRQQGLIDFKGHAERHGNRMLYDSTVIALGGPIASDQLRALDGHRRQFASDRETGRSAPGRLRLLMERLICPETCGAAEQAGRHLLACLMMAIYSVSSAAMWRVADQIDTQLGTWTELELRASGRAQSERTTSQDPFAPSEVPGEAEAQTKPEEYELEQPEIMEPDWSLEHEGLCWDEWAQAASGGNQAHAPEWNHLESALNSATPLSESPWTLSEDDWSELARSYDDPWLGTEAQPDTLPAPRSAQTLPELLHLLTEPDDDIELDIPTWSVAHTFLEIAARMRAHGVVTGHNPVEPVVWPDVWPEVAPESWHQAERERLARADREGGQETGH